MDQLHLFSSQARPHRGWPGPVPLPGRALQGLGQGLHEALCLGSSLASPGQGVDIRAKQQTHPTQLGEEQGRATPAPVPQGQGSHSTLTTVELSLLAQRSAWPGAAVR